MVNRDSVSVWEVSVEMDGGDGGTGERTLNIGQGRMINHSPKEEGRLGLHLGGVRVGQQPGLSPGLPTPIQQRMPGAGGALDPPQVGQAQF